jgi:hypothetical protein
VSTCPGKRSNGDKSVLERERDRKKREIHGEEERRYYLVTLG